MLDEIQTGLGRTGRWFGFQHEAIRPDVVTIAKALGNGMPIGACWARREVAAAFVAGDHGTTFGGQPLACAAGIATLAELEAIDAPGLAQRTGAYLAQRLGTLGGVASVRGKGLLLGAVLEPGLDAAQVTRTALQLGLVVNAGAGRPAPGAAPDGEHGRGGPSRGDTCCGTRRPRRRADKRRRPQVTNGRPTKHRRQHLVVRLLADNEVSSQEQLVELLGREGVAATQATVSRDLEEIGALKVRVPGLDRLVYAVPELPRDQIAPLDHLRRVLGEWVVEMAASGNLVVLRTPPGSAHVVASAL